MGETAEKAYSEDEIKQRLGAELPHWYYKDFALAKKIEEVVQWQPGREGGALAGTPNEDQRFKYLKYD
jgi:hypothetical protein